MGMAGFPFFGDKTKEELEKELTKVNHEIADLTAQREEILKEINKRDCSAEG